MLKNIAIFLVLGFGVLVAIGSILPEQKDNPEYYACIHNTDNHAEAMFRAMANGEGSSDLAVANELNKICRNFSN